MTPLERALPRADRGAPAVLRFRDHRGLCRLLRWSGDHRAARQQTTFRPRLRAGRRRRDRGVRARDHRELAADAESFPRGPRSGSLWTRLPLRRVRSLGAGQIDDPGSRRRHAPARRGPELDTALRRADLFRGVTAGCIEPYRNRVLSWHHRHAPAGRDTRPIPSSRSPTAAEPLRWEASTSASASTRRASPACRRRRARTPSRRMAFPWRCSPTIRRPSSPGSE